MRTDFRKSVARDLRRRKNDSDFLDRVKEAIEDVEPTRTCCLLKKVRVHLPAL